MICPGSGLVASETPRGFRPTPPPRGTCQKCGGEYALNIGWRVRKHKAPPAPERGDLGGSR